MKLFAIPNLSAAEVFEIDISAGAPDFPRPTFRDKDAYRRWSADKKTSHAFISPFEGLSPGLRISGANPPRLLHGLILEFDAKAPKEHSFPDARILPAYKILSFSGNMRLLFPFAEPLPVDEAELAKEFLKIAHKNLRAKRLGPGFEAEESSRPEQVFEIGSPWIPIGGSPIAPAVVYSWMAEAVGRVRWERRGIVLPFDRLRARGEELFPGRWPGGWAAFAPGARGTRFWDPGADAESVLVTETGCACFTGDRAFLSWVDIFGADFVRELTGGVIGDAISKLWWLEGSTEYYRQYPGGEIGAVKTLTDLKLHLRALGLRDEKTKGEELTDVEKAIYSCQMLDARRVDYVIPLPNRPTGVVYHNGYRFLNTSRVRAMTPAPGPGPAWGEGFPWIADYFDHLFDTGQKERFLSWTAHYYSAALRGRPGTGLALFIAGDASIGKNFLSNAILGQLFGKHADASRYVTGEDDKNGRLIASPLWTLHDSRQTSETAAGQNAYTQQLKRIIANREIISRAMYREGIDIPWNGRVVATLNLDPESLRMLPDLEQAVLNKVLLLKASNPEVDRFPSDEEIARELPFFGAYLRDFEIPEDIREERFGIVPWAHPALLEAAHAESSTTGALEILSMWRAAYFKNVVDGKVAFWSGNASELMGSMLEETASVAPLVRGQFRNPTSLGRALNKIVGQKSIPWLSKTPGGRRAYRIERP